MTKIMVVFGTRPEAIKLAPLIRALRETPGAVPIVCVTGQHRDLLDQALAVFGIKPDTDLALMRADQGLNDLTARLLTAFEPVLERERPDWVVVQGDTTTTMAAALAAFHRGVRVAHVEAGLRTGDRHRPFPEEINRRIVSLVGDLHFAPTARARDALLAEGVRPDTIHVTGNTGIDSLFWMIGEIEAGRTPPHPLLRDLDGKRLVLVTAHRRESFDTGLAEICDAVRTLVSQVVDVAVLLPVHPNPRVAGPIRERLADAPRVILAPPLDYAAFVAALHRASLVLTDSGGVQEEAATLGKPLLVLRDVTERPEALEGGGVLVGAHKDAIVEQALRLLSGAGATTKSTQALGDGRASARIAAALMHG